jgi:2-iminoacetate synthase
VLFGLYDWRFEVMGLLYHTIHLEETFNGVGPHTISFPASRRPPILPSPSILSTPSATAISKACGNPAAFRSLYRPHLHRQRADHVRQEVIPFGVSQIDAGTRIGVGSYAQSVKANELPDKNSLP